MKIEQFLAENRSRLTAYAATYCRRFRLPVDMEGDLFNAAVIGAMGALPYWKESLGADGAKARSSKSVFNWCAGPMRREMERAMRSHLGYKPNSKGEIARVCDAFHDDLGDGVQLSAMTVEAKMADVCELRRLLRTTPRTPHLVRFLAVALSPAGGADLARAQGVSRQAICVSVKQARRDLKAALA